MLRPEGEVRILVPAHQIIYGKIDKKVGHFRRYSKKSLFKLMEKSGFNEIKIKRFNKVGLFNWFLSNLLNQQISSKTVKLNELLVPLYKIIDRAFPLPCSQSLIVSANK